MAANGSRALRVGRALAERASSVNPVGVLSVPAVKAAVPSRYKYAGRRAFLRVAAVANAGSRVSCPCCGRHFRKFARFHGEHDQCPACGSLMRHRALLLFLRDVLRVQVGSAEVLHVGPGPSLRRWLKTLPGVSYLSTDLDPSVADVRADVTALPFDDRSFDLVLCIHVLEHVPDDRAAIRELFRVLRPGGTAVLQLPPSHLEETSEDPAITDPAEREEYFGQFDHVRLCGRDYGDRLEEAGFDVAFVDYVERLDDAIRDEYGLRVGEPFYVCTRPAGA
jgi:SAM-dependent methyltransferase